MKIIQNILRKVYSILVCPLYTMMPFLLSMALLSVLVAIVSPDVEYLLSGYGFGNTCTFYCLSVLMACLPWTNIRRALEYIIIIVTCLLDIIETFCNINFGLFISPTLIQLIIGTNPEEAKGFMSEFVLRYETLPLLAAYVAVIALIVFFYRSKAIASLANRLFKGSVLRYVVLIIPLIAISICCLRPPVKKEYLFLLASRNISTFELRYKNGAYSNIQRLILAMRLVSFTTHENKEIVSTLEKTTIDGCSHSSPLIMLIIGESYVMNHSQLYGYQKETTPFQLSEQSNGRLFAFTNCITPNNLTSMVFRNLLSVTRADDKNFWNKHTLFPRLLRIGGYYTAFISNQFVPTSRGMFDFLGGFYLNDPTISKLLFDVRNTKRTALDGELLPEFANAIKRNAPYKFIIFHEGGMHVPFAEKYPSDYAIFKATDYDKRKELSASEKQTVAHYDNAVRYNDHVKELLLKQLEDQDAIVIFVPDHGEEVLDYTHRIGRTQKSFTPAILLSEYRIPMWIWCSNEYMDSHSEVVSRIKQSTNKPFMTDDLPHLILDLAGVNSNDFHPQRSVINPNYDMRRKRMIGPDYNHNYDDIINASDNVFK